MSLGNAQEFCDYYKHAGPSTLSSRLLNPNHVFGFDGYMNVMLGLKAETVQPPKLSDQDWASWDAFTARMKGDAQKAMTTEEAIEFMQNN